MASPFRLFRKYQKAFLAIAAVLAMVIFVFADLFTSAMSGPAGGSQNKTLVTWDGGSLGQMELERLVQRRVFISQFLSRLLQTGASKLVENGGTPIEPAIPNFILPERTTVDQIYYDCANNRLLAQQAKEAGISVTDVQINNYLKEISFGQLNGSEIIALFRGNKKQSEARLVAGLQELLLANTYLSSFNSAISSVPPEQRWSDWRQVNERIVVEAAVLPASQFVSKVPDPTEAEINDFYQKYRDQEDGQYQRVAGKVLPYPEPGFREPRRVKMQYLMGDVAGKSQALMDSITDEEIAEFYEDNKDEMFVKSSADSDSQTAEEESAEEGDAEQGDTDEETTEAAETENTEGSAEAADEQPESSADEPVDTEEDSAAEAKEDVAEEAAEAVESESTEQPAEDTSNDTSSKVARSPFRLTALQGDTAEDEDSTATDESVTTDSDAGDAQAGEAAEDTEDSTPSEDTEEASSDEQVEYDSLEDVKDIIRNKLATDKAVEEIRTQADKAYSQLDSTYRDYSLALAEAEDEEKELPEVPAALKDTKELAKTLGFTHEETVLRSRSQLSETIVGRAVDASKEQGQQTTVAREAFSRLSLYEPYLAKEIGSGGNWFVVQKVEDVASRVPELEEVRDKVIEAWKQQEAAKLALAKAEEYAKTLSESGEDFNLFFAGKPYETVTTDMFSWMTFGPIPLEYQARPPQLGEAPPLEAVGIEFMSKAFDLGTDEVAAVLNHSQTQAFVFKLAKREQTEAKLRQQFLEEANTTRAGLILMQMRVQEASNALQGRIRERANLNWDALVKHLQPKSDG